MTAETNIALQKAAELFLNKAQQGFEFVEAQVPDVLMQVIAYHRVFNIVELIISLILFRFLYLGVTKCYKMTKADGGDDFFPIFGTIFSFVSGIAITILTICVTIPSLIKVWVAPKMFLLEYLSNLVK